MDGKIWTIHGIYTDRYHHSAAVKSCHHDGTPAFDLMANGGTPIFAITDGKVTHVNPSYTLNNGPGKPCNSLQFFSTKENSYFWYGHILADPGIENKTFHAGEKLGVVATKDYGTKCYGGGTHLHIDRGCVDGAGKRQTGGSPGCRDPAFLLDLVKIWESLPL